MSRLCPAAKAIVALGMLFPCGAIALQPPEPPPNLTLRLLNPYQPDHVPDTVHVTFLSGAGKAIASFERPVVEGRLEGIPRPPDARRLLVDAALFESAPTDLEVAADHGIVLLPYARVAVLLHDGAAGGPVRLWLRRTSDGMLIRRADTLEPGRPTELRIPAGDWELVARSAGFAPASSHVTAGPASTVRHVLPAWQPGLHLKIVVVDASSGTPVPGTAATWEPADAENPLPGGGERPADQTSLLALAVNDPPYATNDFGRFEAAELPGSSHAWRIAAEGFRSARHRIEIRAGEHEKNVGLSLRPSPDLAIAVNDLGTPSVPLVLEIGTRDLRASSRTPFRSFWTGPAPVGPSRTFRRLPDGEYRLDLKDPAGVLQERLWLSPASAEWQRDRIALTLVREPRKVTGRVLRGDEPLEGVLIFGVLASRSWPPEDYIPPQELLFRNAPRTDANGYYALELGGPGRYGIGYSLPEKSIDGTAGPLDLTSATAAELDVHVPAGDLQLQVVSARTGDPVGEASFEIVLEGASSGPDGRNFLAHADERGRYTLGGVDAKRAMITVAAPGFESKRVETPVTESGDDTPAVIQLKPVRPLRLRVADRQGLPVPGAEVWTLEEMVWGDVEPRAKLLATSDAAGLAVIESPGSTERPYFCLARGYTLELAVLASPGDGNNGEIPLSLSPIEVTYPLVLTGSNRQPVIRAALAFRRFGVIYPWALLGQKVGQEGLDLQSTLTSDGSGRIPVHELLAPGQYDAFRFTPAAFPDRPSHSFVPAGHLTLPLQSETSLTVERKGGL